MKRISSRITLIIVCCTCMTVLLAYISLSNWWKMFILPEAYNTHSELYIMGISLAVMLTLCVVLSILVARKLGNMIEKPIQTMVEAARRIGGGDLNVFVEIDTKDEMQELAQAFNEMVSNVSILNHELAIMAYYDQLTGMENKNMFEKRAHSALENPTDHYAYIILDINKFKLINDLFGVEQGDRLLIHVSTVLSTELRDGELAARFNADHFHMLYQYSDRAELEERLHRVFDKVTAYTFDRNPSYKLSIVFGVYVVEEESPVISLVGDKAKLALDKIKGSHSYAAYFYNDSIRHKILEEQEIENTMEASLLGGEFKVYLQPKYEPYTGQMTGSEALARWAHPRKGIIQPDQFIPVFERNSFIEQLDRYILEEVCKIIRTQLDDGIEPMLVSVNQSRQYLNPHSYISTITEIVNRYDIPYRLIELEITETAFFEDQSEMLKIVRSLHDMGFVVSLDDFGSGYSSFNILQDMTIDVLKIDKNFFSESVNSDRGKKIVSNIITMAHELGISVIAEGVETLDQVEFLVGAKCDEIQGYYYSRPVPQVEIDVKWREQAAQRSNT